MPSWQAYFQVAPGRAALLTAQPRMRRVAAVGAARGAASVLAFLSVCSYWKAVNLGMTNATLMSDGARLEVRRLLFRLD